MNLYKLTFENKTTAYRLAETEKQLLKKQKRTENIGFVVSEIKLIKENAQA